MRIIVALLGIFLCSFLDSAWAQEGQPIGKPFHESNVVPELRLQQEEFTFDKYTQALDWLKNTLSKQISGEDIGWEERNIGIPNSILELDGYGLFSQREIVRLKLEIAELQHATVMVEDLQQQLQVLDETIDAFLTKNIWVD